MQSSNSKPRVSDRAILAAAIPCAFAPVVAAEIWGYPAVLIAKVPLVAFAAAMSLAVVASRHPVAVGSRLLGYSTGAIAVAAFIDQVPGQPPDQIVDTLAFLGWLGVPVLLGALAGAAAGMVINTAVAAGRRPSHWVRRLLLASGCLLLIGLFLQIVNTTILSLGVLVPLPFLGSILGGGAGLVMTRRRATRSGAVAES